MITDTIFSLLTGFTSGFVLMLGLMMVGLRGIVLAYVFIVFIVPIAIIQYHMERYYGINR